MSKVPAPSTTVLSNLFATASAVVKTQYVRWPQSPPDEVVVTKQFPNTPNETFQNLEISVVRWSPHYHNWNVVWNGPLVRLQQGFSPGHPVVPAITAWKTVRFGQRGMVVGLVYPVSLGASNIWGGAQLLWLPATGQPRILWSTPRHFLGLNDGYLVRQGHSLLVAENACWAVEAAPNRQDEPVVRHPTCTDLLAHTPGKHLGFVVAGSTIIPKHAVVTVPVGSRVVFWPANLSAVQATNANTLVLLWGPQGQADENGTIANDMADTIGFWAWTFRAVGTYDFALVTTKDYQSGQNPPILWTIHVVAEP